MIIPCWTCGEIAEAVIHCQEKSCPVCGGEPTPSFCSDGCMIEFEQKQWHKLSEHVATNGKVKVI